jgi:pyruvate/2-oxoacid:ferredoxin oxidoreductase beta subunit
MIIRRNLSAQYPLNARKPNGQRVETDTITDAAYAISDGYGVILERSLSGGGLEIRHDDNTGDGFLWVIIGNKELVTSGRLNHNLTITCCDGSIYPTALRPSILTVEA